MNAPLIRFLASRALENQLQMLSETDMGKLMLENVTVVPWLEKYES